MKSIGRAEAPAGFTNEEVALAALLALGGDLTKIDTEDVALRADQLSPGRFRWRKYKEHIDLGLVRNGLQDAKKNDHVKGGALEGWSLTNSGLPIARTLLGKVGNLEEHVRLTQQQKAWLSRERARLSSDGAFKAVRQGLTDTLSETLVLRFFRIDEYVNAEGRQERVERLVRAFGDDPVLGPVIETLAKKVPQ
jgi:hypothetical protein